MRKHNYVVGYQEEGRSAYGKPFGHYSIGLLTLIQAKKLSKEHYWTDDKGKIHKSVVYKLVRVK